jgi:hypothetical protein
VPGYPEAQIELISEVCLREILRVEDDDPLRIFTELDEAYEHSAALADLDLPAGA